MAPVPPVADTADTADTDAKPPLRARTRTWWLVRLVLVLPLETVVPLAWSYAAWRAWAGWAGRVPGWLEGGWFDLGAGLWAASEVLFSLYILYLTQGVQASSSHPPHFTPALAKSTLVRILNTGLVTPNEPAAIKRVDSGISTPAQTPTQSGRRRTVAEDEEDARRVEGELSAALEGDEEGDMVERLEWDDPRARDMRDRLRTWFNHAPWTSLTRSDVLTWLSWSLMGAPYVPSSLPYLSPCLALIERRTGSTLSDTRTPNTRTPHIIRLTLDPVRVRSRPLGLYLLVAAAQWAAQRCLMGKELGAVIWKGEEGREYLVRLPEGYDPKDEARTKPIVFLHGLGIGLPQYGRTISGFLRAFPRRPIVVPLSPATSMSFFNAHYLRPFSRAENSAGLRAVLARLGGGPADVVSHSFGTVTHAHLLKDAPDLVDKSVFMDPVIFCLWEGDLCWRFLYRIPRTGIELLMHYFIATELGLAHTLQRQFSWSCNLLWPSEFEPSRTLIFMGGKDSVYDATRVKSYLERHGFVDGLHYRPEGRHGEVLLPHKGGGMPTIHRWLGDAPPVAEAAAGAATS